MGRTACTEPQCLYKGDIYLYLTWSSNRRFRSGLHSLWHSCQKWHAERFPWHVTFTAVPIFFLLPDQRLCIVEKMCGVFVCVYVVCVWCVWCAYVCVCGVYVCGVCAAAAGSSSSNVIVMTLNKLVGFLVHCFTSKRKCPVVQIRKRLPLGWFLTCGWPGVFFEDRT